MNSPMVGRLRARMHVLMADGLVGLWKVAARVGSSGPSSRHARGFHAVGANTAFGFPPGPTLGEQWISIGSQTLVGPYVALSAGLWVGENLEPERGWVVRIGDRCNIGRGTSIAGRIGIEIGDDVTIAPGVFITDHNHDYDEARIPIMRQWVAQAPVAIGSGSWLGVGAVVLPGTTLGENVAVAAGSVVRGDIPDRCVVAGAPAKVVRRWDDDLGRWDPPLSNPLGPTDIPPGWYEAEPAYSPRART